MEITRKLEQANFLKMPSLDMHGPYPLTAERINEAINRTSAGNYALGYPQNDGTFIVRYVGRSDNDLKGRLQQWLANVGRYTHFKFSYASSPQAAFNKECQNYHDFGGPEGRLDNQNHPQKPDETNWRCHVCGA